MIIKKSLLWKLSGAPGSSLYREKRVGAGNSAADHQYNKPGAKITAQAEKPVKQIDRRLER